MYNMFGGSPYENLGMMMMAQAEGRKPPMPANPTPPPQAPGAEIDPNATEVAKEMQIDPMMLMSLGMQQMQRAQQQPQMPISQFPPLTPGQPMQLIPLGQIMQQYYRNGGR